MRGEKRTMKKQVALAVCGAAAGVVNGLFGAGGGMVLVPLMTLLGAAEPEEIFPSSVSIIFPMCIVSFAVRASAATVPLAESWEYLAGGAAGGVLAAIFG